MLPVTATADNCLLTCYNFLSNNQSDFHIICECVKGKKEPSETSGDTAFVPCVSPIRAPTCVSMVTSSTPFSLRTSTYADSSVSSSSSPSTRTVTPVEQG